MKCQSLCSRVTADMLTQEPSASPTTSPAPTETLAPAPKPTYLETPSPTEKTFPAVCAGGDEASTLRPHVAVGAFDDADLWTPRGVPSTEAYVEVPGALSAHAYGHEPELLVSSAAGASARGLLLLGPSKLSFSAGAGLYLGETDSMPPLCHDVTTAGLTAIPTLAPTATIAPTAAPTYKTLSPTEATFPGICDDAAAVLNPRVASASFADEAVWIPRGTPSVAEFVEVAGGLSAYAFSYEPELAVSADVSARGLALHGPSKLSFAAGAGLRLGQTESMPATCPKHTLDTLVQTTAAPSVTPAPTHLPTSPPTASPSANRFSTICASTDDTSALLKPHLASASFEDPAVWMPPGAPSGSAYVEISGAMSAQEYGYYEPELLISSDAAALGVALHGPSKLAFAAGAGLRLGLTDEMPVPLLGDHGRHADANALGVAYSQFGPDHDARADANVRP